MSRTTLRAMLHRHADELADALEGAAPANGDARPPAPPRPARARRTLAASDTDRAFAARELRRMDLLPARGPR